MGVIRELINNIGKMASALQGGVVDNPEEVLESNAIPKEIRDEFKNADSRVNKLISGKGENIKTNNLSESYKLKGKGEGRIDARTREKDGVEREL